MSTTIFRRRQVTGEHSLLIIERFLRDRDDVWRQIRDEQAIGGLLHQMLISSTVALAAYGGVIGLSHSIFQALASAIKLPLLFLLTLAICLPTLYLFNLLCGGRLSPRQALALGLAAITVSSALTLAFAPITLFFMITAPDYIFFVLLNVAILALTGFIGLRFLVSGVSFLNREPADSAPPPPPPLPLPGARQPRQPREVSLSLLQIWLLLFAFVGTQLGWTLRPFFGMPGYPFVLFRPIESNFYVGVFELLVSMFRF